MPPRGISPGIAGRSGASVLPEAVVVAKLGLIVENFNPVLATAGTAPATQVAYGEVVGLANGELITGIALWNQVAAAGTLPATARFGIADSTGKILAISGNENALAQWAVGINKHPLAAPYTIPADGLYYLCFVVNGVWGTTQPTPLRVTGGLGAAMVPTPQRTFQWAAQTDLPAVGSSLTLATGSAVPYYLAAY
jgi:hypothetical protein